MITETGYDGVMKSYKYSPAGKLTGMKRGESSVWAEMAYDQCGQLSEIKYENGDTETFTLKVEEIKGRERQTTIRHLGDTGNVYETRNKTDREYGRGGQLIAAKGRKYGYDACGDLVEKKESDGKTWRYSYHPGGMLEKVTRPDGKDVSFAYDPLGRRVSKKYDGKTTKFLWDGDKIIHEWIVETKPETEEQQPAKTTAWLFDENDFTPLAKLTNKQMYSVMSNHLGTPYSLLDQNGKSVWKAEFDIYGRSFLQEGGRTEEEKCPFRFQGQYEDEETGLYYNRFRYYDPVDGIYTQRDPIGLAGGNPTVYGYVSNPTRQIDPLGLHEILSNTDIVVRGGTCSADSFAKGSGVSQNSLTGKLNGISTQAKPGANLAELAQPFPHNKVGVSTVGEIEKAGGKIIMDGKLNSPNGTMIKNHATVNGLTADQAEKLFTPTTNNPVPNKLRGCPL